MVRVANASFNYGNLSQIKEINYEGLNQTKKWSTASLN